MISASSETVKTTRIAVAEFVAPGSSPPSGPAIQPGKKPSCVIGESRLGRFAAIATRTSEMSSIAPSAIAAARRPGGAMERMRPVQAARSRAAGTGRQGTCVCDIRAAARYYR